MELEASKELHFYIHDELHKVKLSDIKPNTSLNTYLRQNMHLTGTKYMCKEGGCGACIVGVTVKHPVTKKDNTFAVNSCLIPLIVCQSWKISTVEGIGNAKNGYNKIQKTLANFNGTQCGFCSSGMVMNMYSLLKNKDNKVTMKEMENSFGGNLCRCTGYRPILTAFKTLCVDADKNLIGSYPELDIEDLHFCPGKGQPCDKECKELCTPSNTPLYFDFQDTKWYKVFTIGEIFQAFDKSPTGSYMLVCGNTAQGVYPLPLGQQFNLYIDITSVRELMDYKLTDDKLILGANMSLTATMELFYKLSAENPKFKYLSKLADHIDLIANVPVRNVGSLAGNLMIKHDHKEFPSDIFLIFTTVKAEVTICIPNKIDTGILSYLSSFVYSSDDSEITMGMEDFLSFDMDRKVMKNIMLPAYDATYYYESYKIMPRAQNAHALVNAGFLLKLNGMKVDSARIVYGGINPNFVRARGTEKFLAGKVLFDNNTLQGAYKVLDNELKPDYVLPDPPPDFRKFLAISLFYKYILSICPLDKVTPTHKTGSLKLSRPVSSGVQDFETDQSLYPLGEPIPKIEALAQTSGAAEYFNDIPEHPLQLHAAFVTAEAPANSVIKSIDTTEALKMKGVVAYFDKKHVPGKNTFTPNEANFPKEETLFCNGTVEYYHQPIGIIVAETEEMALRAALMVKVVYTPGTKPPLLTVRDMIKAGAADKLVHVKDFPRTKPIGTDVKHVIKGTFDIYHQYHFHMETQICTVIPVEDGLDMFTSTQFMDLNQTAAAVACKIPVNRVNLQIRRLGGAFGAKISRNSLISTATAVAAYKLQRPVKMNLTLSDNMKICGGRYPLSIDYEVGTNDRGVIQYMNAKYWNDYGGGGAEIITDECLNNFTSKYKNGTWEISVNSAFADTPSGTWTRAPGTTEGLAGIESIMEHICHVVNRDPVDLRLDNIDPVAQADMVKFINQLVDWADIKKRQKEIEDYNKANRWMKKGLSVVPNNYNFYTFGNWTVLVSIFNGDGSVAVCHGGIEMGQGLNTKAAQVCAYSLGIPLDKVSIKPSYNVVSPNAMSTGGSITSEAICYGVIQACKILNERINNVRKDLPAGTPWEKVIKDCYLKFVDLTATYMYSPVAPDVQGYRIYGVCATEVIVDVLTGSHMITRVDLLEDTGDSLSPWIDIGQVEGAYVMGAGYYTCEEFITSKEGKVMTNRTWNYKVPGVKDIPVDFRVKFPSKNPNPVGILKSKATAEPPLNLAVSLPLAIRRAMASARVDADAKNEKWVKIEGPVTVANTLMNCGSNYAQYTL